MIGYPQFIGKVPEDHWTRSGWTMPEKKINERGISIIPNQMTIFDILDDDAADC